MRSRRRNNNEGDTTSMTGCNTTWKGGLTLQQLELIATGDAHTQITLQIQFRGRCFHPPGFGKGRLFGVRRKRKMNEVRE